MPKLHISPHFHIEILDYDQVVLFSEDKQHLLQGVIYTDISKLLCQGSLAEEDLIKSLSSRFSLQHILEALSRLKEKLYFAIS